MGNFTTLVYAILIPGQLLCPSRSRHVPSRDVHRYACACSPYVRGFASGDYNGSLTLHTCRFLSSIASPGLFLARPTAQISILSILSVLWLGKLLYTYRTA